MNATHREGRPVVAVGTTVLRALHSAWDGSRMRAATGFHEPETSHQWILTAVAGSALVEDAYAEAEREGYLWHEFGDSHLILATNG